MLFTLSTLKNVDNGVWSSKELNFRAKMPFFV